MASAQKLKNEVAIASNAERIYLWDNIKAVLIFLVVLGHAILPTLHSDFMKGAYIWINTFHMPLFIYISGLFSKNAINAKRLNFKKIISYILIFYFMKATIYLCVLFARGYAFFRVFYENGTPWYIFVTAVHLLVSFLVKKLNAVAVVIVSFALSIAAGYWDAIGNTMMISRMIVFFPLFYLGYLTNTDKLLNVLRNKWVRIVSLIVFAAFTYFAFAKGRFFFRVLRPLYTGSNSYLSLPEACIPFGPLLRMFVYVFSALIGLSLASIMPAKKVPLLSYIGTKTLSVYALHRQGLYFYQFSTLPAVLATWLDGYLFTVLVVASILITIILSLKPVGYLLFPCTHFDKWMFPIGKWIGKLFSKNKKHKNS